MDNNAVWITDKRFEALSPINLFTKEHFKPQKNYDKDLLNSHVLFRKKFEAMGNQKYIIHISADDYYRLYINGKFVCSGPAPCYPWHYYYNEVDITKYVKSGINTLAVHTYYQGLINRVWVSGDRRHGLICTVYESDSPIVVSNESFKCAYHTGYGVYKIGVDRHDTFFCEQYDSNSTEENFECETFDDSLWEYSVKKQVTDYKLFKQETDVQKYYVIAPEKIEKIEGGYRVDIGREIIGYITAVASSKNGDTITVRYAEELNDDGSVRYQMRCNCYYENKWKVKGENNIFRTFDYRGFRYAEFVTDGDAIIDENEIKIIVRHYPFSEVQKCPINDSDINKVWNLCVDTIKYGTQECFIDCPTREKGQYLGDTCISAVANAILTGNGDMLKKSIRNFADSAVICKGIMAVSTSSFMQEIADFSLLFPMTVLWHYRLTGETELVKEMIPVVCDLADYFKKYERTDGLITNVSDKWNLVDWPENLRDNYDFPLTNPIGDGCHNVINAFYIGMLKCVNRMKEICGMEFDDISRYERAFINEFFDRDNNIFIDCKNTKHGSIHSNVLPLLFNIPANEITKQNAINTVKLKRLTSSGTYFSFFILQAMKNLGERELVIELIKDKKAWLNMISEGATTAYEAWGKDQKKNTSLCHPWSVSPILILFDM